MVLHDVLDQVRVARGLIVAYHGKLLSNELLLHAIRSAKPALTDWQGKPITMVTLRRQADGSLRHNGDYKRHKRRELFKRQHGMCWYCKGRMVLVERVNGGPKIRQHPDEATIEHLYPRYSRERGKHSGKVNIVLAHNRCNSERSASDQRAISRRCRYNRCGKCRG